MGQLPADITEKIAKLGDLFDQQSKLFEELKRSVAIKQLWNEAFACGELKGITLGSVGGENHTYEIHRTDGEVKRFKVKGRDYHSHRRGRITCFLKGSEVPDILLERFGKIVDKFPPRGMMR